MQYKLTGVVRRVVNEEYDVLVEADSQEEAADVVYAILSDYPDSELSSARLLCTGRENMEEPRIVDIAIHGQEFNDLGEEIYE